MKNITKVRTYSQSMPLAEAVEKAIKECIQEDVLSELLRRNQEEVYMSSLFEYDEEKQRMQENPDLSDEKLAKEYIFIKS